MVTYYIEAHNSWCYCWNSYFSDIVYLFDFKVCFLSKCTRTSRTGSVFFLCFYFIFQNIIKICCSYAFQYNINLLLFRCWLLLLFLLLAFVAHNDRKFIRLWNNLLIFFVLGIVVKWIFSVVCWWAVFFVSICYTRRVSIVIVYVFDFANTLYSIIYTKLIIKFVFLFKV